MKAMSSRIAENDCPVALRRVIFDNLKRGGAFGELAYRGRIIREFDDLFHNTPNNNLLLYPAQYALSTRTLMRSGWQVERVRDILTRRYGITMVTSTNDSIIIEQSGSLFFVKKRQKVFMRSAHRRGAAAARFVSRRTESVSLFERLTLANAAGNRFRDPAR